MGQAATDPTQDPAVQEPVEPEAIPAEPQDPAAPAEDPAPDNTEPAAE